MRFSTYADSVSILYQRSLDSRKCGCIVWHPGFGRHVHPAPLFLHPFTSRVSVYWLGPNFKVYIGNRKE
jgi:hypothetical protein